MKSTIIILTLTLFIIFFITCSSDGSKDALKAPPKINNAKGYIKLNNKKYDINTKSSLDLIYDRNNITLDTVVDQIDFPYKSLNLSFANNVKDGEYKYVSKGKKGIYNNGNKSKSYYSFICGLNNGKDHPSPLDGYKIESGKISIAKSQNSEYYIYKIKVSGLIGADFISRLVDGNSKPSIEVELDLYILKTQIPSVQ